MKYKKCENAATLGRVIAACAPCGKGFALFSDAAREQTSSGAPPSASPGAMRIVASKIETRSLSHSIAYIMARLMNRVNAPLQTRYLLNPMRVDLSKHVGPLLDVRVESSWESKNFAEHFCTSVGARRNKCPSSGRFIKLPNGRFSGKKPVLGVLGKPRVPVVLGLAGRVVPAKKKNHLLLLPLRRPSEATRCPAIKEETLARLLLAYLCKPPAGEAHHFSVKEYTPIVGCDTLVRALYERAVCSSHRCSPSNEGVRTGGGRNQ